MATEDELRLRRLRRYWSADKKQQDNDKKFLNSLADCASRECFRVRRQWKDMIPCPKCYRCFCEREHFREGWKWGSDACEDCGGEYEIQTLQARMMGILSVGLAGLVLCVLAWALFSWFGLLASFNMADKVMLIICSWLLGASVFILSAIRFGFHPKYPTLSEWKRLPYG